MSQTRTLALLAIALLFVSTHSQLMGGASSHEITPAVQAEAKSMMTRVSSHKLFEELESSQLIYYATQVVAGTNHFMVWEESNGEFICTVLWERLPTQDGTRALELTNDGRSGLLSNACAKCGASFGTNQEICEAAKKIDL
jgi:hypothetical protein